jgi:hypothetical protein
MGGGGVARCSSCSQNAHDRGMEGHPHWSCAPGTEEGMEPDDLLCWRNTPGSVCLVGWSFWFVWFFRMNFWSDQPDRRDKPFLLLARPASLARLASPSVDTCSGRPSSQPSRAKVDRRAMDIPTRKDSRSLQDGQPLFILPDREVTLDKHDPTKVLLKFRKDEDSGD